MLDASEAPWQRYVQRPPVIHHHRGPSRCVPSLGRLLSRAFRRGQSDPVGRQAFRPLVAVVALVLHQSGPSRFLVIAADQPAATPEVAVVASAATAATTPSDPDDAVISAAMTAHIDSVINDARRNIITNSR